METKINIVTTVDGVGVAEAKNDLAKFTFSVKAKSESLELAKKQVEELTDVAMEELRALKKKGMKLDGEIQCDLSNYRLEHREAGEKFAAGFQSVNTISFTAVVNEALNDINAVCLKLDPHMNRPIFSIKNREALLNQAIQKASDDAKNKLAKECSLLNVSSNKLKIYNWNFGYEGYLPYRGSQGPQGIQGVTGATGPQGSIGTYFNQPSMKIGSIYLESLDPVKLDPGAVSVRVVVQVNYVWA